MTSALIGPFSAVLTRFCACYFSMLIMFSLLQVGLLNVDGYYNSLLSFIDKAVEEGFISPSARHIIVSGTTARELVKKLEVIHSTITVI